MKGKAAKEARANRGNSDDTEFQGNSESFKETTRGWVIKSDSSSFFAAPDGALIVAKGVVLVAQFVHGDFGCLLFFYFDSVAINDFSLFLFGYFIGRDGH